VPTQPIGDVDEIWLNATVLGDYRRNSGILGAPTTKDQLHGNPRQAHTASGNRSPSQCGGCTGQGRRRHAGKDRVEKAKDAMARSVGTKGDHVAPARAAIKVYLQRLNEPKQPDDAQFEALIEAPFKAPPKKKMQGGGRF
jgi:hypothetical protein